MTEIAITNPVAAPPAASNGAPPPATPVDPATPATPAVDPAKVEADAKLATDRQEMREIANAKAATFRAQQAEKQARAELASLQEQRKADLDRIAAIQEAEATWSDPDKFLDAAEKRGLTAQKLLKRAAESNSVEDVIKTAEERAKAAAKAEFERLQGERDAETKKSRDEQIRNNAIENWQKEILAKEDDYPAMSALLSAGPVLNETVRQHAFRIYALAADQEREGISHTPEQINKSLEDFLAKEYGSLTERISARAQKPSEGDTGSGTSPAKSAAAAPNVTNAMANGTVSLAPELPKDFKSWSADKQNAFFLDRVRPK